MNTGMRKYTLALLALMSAFTLCWFGQLQGGYFVSALGIILGLYKTANIVDKRLGGAG